MFVLSMNFDGETIACPTPSFKTRTEADLFRTELMVGHIRRDWRPIKDDGTCFGGILLRRTMRKAGVTADFTLSFDIVPEDGERLSLPRADTIRLAA